MLFQKADLAQPASPGSHEHFLCLTRATPCIVQLELRSLKYREKVGYGYGRNLTKLTIPDRMPGQGQRHQKGAEER